MLSKQSQLILIILLLFSLSLACALTGESAEPPAPEVDIIATGVAQTLEAEDSESAPPDTGTEAEAPPEPDIVFQGISFAFDPSLAESVNAENIPAQGDGNPYFGTPDHIRFIFNNYALADTFHIPEIKVYSVEEFRAANETVEESLGKLKAVVDGQQVDSEDIIVADFFGAAQFIRSQVKYLTFQNGSGVRFLSQYGQAAWPIGWPHLFYTFQGFTDDGLYYISAIFPITHPSLPHPDDVVMDDAFQNNFVNYTADTQMHLNLQDSESFVPSMDLMDAVVESLLVGQ